ncbi:MAG: 3-hydroxyisobutyrate dehydrogenase [Atopobiaceae bacterium]|nr:3-hydroxyisobutyrate dehydrogenase [Atopobiaceae bacterium]
MDKELFDYTAQKVDELLAAASSSQETRDAAQSWKEAIAAGEDADAATTKLLDIIDRHHTTIDEVIYFAQGPAKDVLGEEAATGMLAQAKKVKAEGGKYCFCAACVATQKLLAKHGRPVL